MKTLSKDTKNILTFLAVLLATYFVFMGTICAISQTFDLGIAYFMVFIISSMVAIASLDSQSK